jgi:prepilin-type N-terminal cleavage/methylation domain-containing protein
MRRSSNHRPWPTRMGGFTLYELMLTLALAAILFGFAIPSFRT